MSQTIASGAKAPAKSSGIPQWWITVGLFWLGWIFMYADRTILNPIMGEIQGEYGLSGTELGLLNSVFFFSYALLQVPSGVLGDKIGKKKILVPGFILFGIFTAVSGWAVGWFMLLAARLMTGVGQSTYYGPQFGLSSEQIPQERRSVGSAIINSGQAFGVALGMMISSWLVFDQGYSWRSPFFVMAVPTIIVGLLIWFFVKEKSTKNQPAQSSESQEPAKKVPFSALLKNTNLLKTYVMVFCSLFGFFVILTWLPYYLQTERAVAGSDVGFISSLVAWVSIPGGLIFASISDRLGKRKPLVMVLVPLAIVSMISIVWIDSMTFVIAAICLYGFVGKLALDPILVACVADNAPKEIYGSAFGLYNFVGMSSSVVAPLAAGMITDATGSLAAAFYLSAALLLIGMVSILTLKEKPVSVKA